MGRRRQAQAVKLSREERKSLELLIRCGTAEQRQVMRAQIALMAHRGEPTASIAQALGVSAQTVSHWRTRLVRYGVEGLQETPRPGRPRRIGEAQRLELLALACEPAEPDGRATPTLDELVERAIGRGVTEQISRSHLQRILQAGDLRPHRVRQWLHSPDPQFRQKVNEICALYRQAPQGSVVLSIDEKTGIQAIERKHADRAPQLTRTAPRVRIHPPWHAGPHRRAGCTLGARHRQLHGSAHPGRSRGVHGAGCAGLSQEPGAHRVGQPEHPPRPSGMG